MFLLNSRYPLACATHSQLPGVSHAYSEVTRAICRVPSAQFSQAPWYALPDHLCRFRVRSLLELFPGTTPLQGQSNKPLQVMPSVTSSWCRNIYLLPSVPSILCMQHRNPILGYSKAPWGLSVLSRVTGIFTGTTISPGGLLRQCPNHYAFHAGQNLPDKEFRYLRTVIVTAAVHWGFDSMLAHLLLTFQHRAGVSSYTSSFDLAQTCVFGKQLPGPILCGSLS